MRASRSQDRSALPDPQADDHRPRTPRRPTHDAKLRGLLEAGDPAGEVRTAWHAKEVVREIYTIDDPRPPREFVAQLGIDLQDESCPPEVQRLGRTIVRWRHQIAAWHQARHTNGPTEAVNNLIKRIKRVAFGITNWTNYRTRALLYEPPVEPVTFRR